MPGWEGQCSTAAPESVRLPAATDPPPAGLLIAKEKPCGPAEPQLFAAETLMVLVPRVAVPLNTPAELSVAQAGKDEPDHVIGVLPVATNEKE